MYILHFLVNNMFILNCIGGAFIMSKEKKNNNKNNNNNNNNNNNQNQNNDR